MLSKQAVFWLLPYHFWHAHRVFYVFFLRITKLSVGSPPLVLWFRLIINFKMVLSNVLSNQFCIVYRLFKPMP